MLHCIDKPICDSIDCARSDQSCQSWTSSTPQHDPMVQQIKSFKLILIKWNFWSVQCGWENELRTEESKNQESLHRKKLYKRFSLEKKGVQRIAISLNSVDPKKAQFKKQRNLITTKQCPIVLGKKGALASVDVCLQNIFEQQTQKLSHSNSVHLCYLDTLWTVLSFNHFSSILKQYTLSATHWPLKQVYFVYFFIFFAISNQFEITVWLHILMVHWQWFLVVNFW